MEYLINIVPEIERINKGETISMEENQMIEQYSKLLSLPVVRETYKSEAEKAARTKLSYQDYLLRLLEAEVHSKMERSVNRKLQVAGFPQLKRLEEYDFTFQPKVNEKLIRELSQLNFMDEAKNVLFIGASGVGKTHLAISLGIKAAQARKRVLFYTAEQLTSLLASSEVSGQLTKTLDNLSRIDLLIIDELGYLELSRQTARLFFQLISKRYEKGSVVVTSNKPFEKWGEIFQDEAVASAILDRLLHHSYPFLINGESYRLKNIKKNK